MSGSNPPSDLALQGGSLIADAVRPSVKLGRTVWTLYCSKNNNLASNVTLLAAAYREDHHQGSSSKSLLIDERILQADSIGVECSLCSEPLVYAPYLFHGNKGQRRSWRKTH